MVLLTSSFSVMVPAMMMAGVEEDGEIQAERVGVKPLEEAVGETLVEAVGVTPAILAVGALAEVAVVTEWVTLVPA